MNNKFYCISILIRFEAEISSANLFVPHQVRPTIIGSNTYSQVQQKLQNQPSTTVVSAASAVAAATASSQPQSVAQPAFISTFMPHTEMPEKSYNSEPTPVVLSSAPKMYIQRPTISLPQPPDIPQPHHHHHHHHHHNNHHTNHHHHVSQPHIDISSIQFDVTQKLKKLKAEKSGPNPIAEAAIQAAKASSALQNFQINEKRKKDKKVHLK